MSLVKVKSLALDHKQQFPSIWQFLSFSLIGGWISLLSVSGLWHHLLIIERWSRVCYTSLRDFNKKWATYTVSYRNMNYGEAIYVYYLNGYIHNQCDRTIIQTNILNLL